jgi:hypothetical protein
VKSEDMSGNYLKNLRDCFGKVRLAMTLKGSNRWAAGGQVGQEADQRPQPAGARKQGYGPTLGPQAEADPLPMALHRDDPAEDVLPWNEAIRPSQQVIPLEQEGARRAAHHPVDDQARAVRMNVSHHLAYAQVGFFFRLDRKQIAVLDEGQHAVTAGAKAERQPAGQYGLEQLEQGPA